MPDVSKLTIGSSTYDIKDTVARNAINSKFSYVVSTDAATTPKDVTWTSGTTTITGTLVASASTQYKIYMVPSSNGTNDIYDEYITVNSSGTTYVWEKIGNTDVDLSNYSVKSHTHTIGTATIKVPTANSVSFNYAKTTSVAGSVASQSAAVTVTGNTTTAVTLSTAATSSTGAVKYIESITAGTNISYATGVNTASIPTAVSSTTATISYANETITFPSTVTTGLSTTAGTVATGLKELVTTNNLVTGTGTTKYLTAAPANNAAASYSGSASVASMAISGVTIGTQSVSTSGTFTTANQTVATASSTGTASS